MARRSRFPTRDVLSSVPKAREKDITAFLRAAVKADPSTRAGKAALRAAESAALRLARDLRRIGREHGVAELDERANDAYFKAVLARQLPRLVEVIQRPRPIPGPIDLDPIPLLPTDPPSPPENVTADAGIGLATVRWTHANALLENVSTFTVNTFTGGMPVFSTTVPVAARETPILGLVPGTAYQFNVVATNTNGDSAPSALTPPITIDAVPTGGAGLPLNLPLPAFSSDPALLIDAAAEPLRAYISDAARIGGKWRYEHLKLQAIAAAREAMQYEEHIGRLMSMAVDKLGTAEEIFNATMLHVFAEVSDLRGGLAEAAESPELDSLLDPLGDAAAQSLLLPKFFAWLIEKGPLDFWIGLFEALISDLASVFPGFSTGLGRTRRYIKHAFDTDLDDVRDDLRAAAQDIVSRLDGEIDRMIAPLRTAIDEVIAGMRAAMADVFEGSDVTLLLTPAAVPEQPDIPDVDPLEDLYGELDAQVNELAARVKERVITALGPLLDPAGNGGSLFEAIVITFLVLPILAFLVISLAGGPFSAALLAAAVLLAAEELLRLLVQWLAGPLLKKIDELQERLAELVGRLQAFFALQAQLVQINNPEDSLRVLASQLRQLSDFLPQEFLHEAAGVLQEARNIVLRTATQLGLAAEQALGAENATAFETIREDYATNLIEAAQLPGGSDRSRLAGAALLRDFGRLEEQRTAVRDPKEIELTHRVSLLRLLGGDAAAIDQFVQRRELLVSLTERDLLDRMFPGVYRALIKDVRATGVLTGTIDPRLHGIPLSITHLGESRTRVRRNANPFAPPLQLPQCFPPTDAAFARAVLGPALRRPPFEPPGEVFDPIILFAPFADILEIQIKRIFDTVTLFQVNEYAFLLLVLIFAGRTEDEIGEVFGTPFRDALLPHLPDALERLAVDKSCGLVDGNAMAAATRAFLDRAASEIGKVMIPVLLADVSNPTAKPDLGPSLEPLANLLRNGFTSGMTTVLGLVDAAKEAWREGKARFLRRVARWGEVDFEEDPDPQVRALGFVRMVRRAPQETMVYNLFPPDSAAATRAHPAAGAPDGPPFMPSSSLQYRPFENRGIEGDFLVRLEALDEGGGTLSQLSGSLSDVILDITIRGCYDADLAQTVRASRSQTASMLDVASNLPAALGEIALPGAVPKVAAAASELRTVRYSLRAHRDRTLQAISAAVLAQPTPPAALTALVAGKSMLRRDAAFESLDPAVTTFTLELTGEALPETVAALQSLVGTLRVSPEDLGLDAAVLTNRELLEPARLTAIGVAVIPMPEGVRPDVDPPVLADPMNIGLTVTGFGGFDQPATALPKRLVLLRTADPPAVAELFSAAAAPSIAFDLAGAPGLLYDVVVSLTFRVPVLRVHTAIDALR